MWTLQAESTPRTCLKITSEHKFQWHHLATKDNNRGEGVVVSKGNKVSVILFTQDHLKYANMLSLAMHKLRCTSALFKQDNQCIFSIQSLKCWPQLCTIHILLWFTVSCMIQYAYAFRLKGNSRVLDSTVLVQCCQSHHCFPTWYVDIPQPIQQWCTSGARLSSSRTYVTILIYCYIELHMSTLFSRYSIHEGGGCRRNYNGLVLD